MNNSVAFKLLQAIVSGTVLPLIGDEIFCAAFVGKVYSKGRPRFGKGHAFTPKNTRDFEKSVKNWLIGECGEPVDFPCAVEIVLYDPIPKSAPRWLRMYLESEVVFSKVGDIDNRAKAILDAANELIFTDDSLVVDLHVRRHYGPVGGFKMTVRRAGVSAAELDVLRRVGGK